MKEPNFNIYSCFYEENKYLKEFQERPYIMKGEPQLFPSTHQHRLNHLKDLTGVLYIVINFNKRTWDLFCSRKIILSAMLCWYVFNFQGVLYYWLLSFLALFGVNFYVRSLLSTILKHVLRTRPDLWDGVFCKSN